jgi:hypothetical protein
LWQLRHSEREGFGDHGDEAWADFSLGAILIRSAKAFFNSSNNPFLPKTSLPSADAAAIAKSESSGTRKVRGKAC